MIAAYGGLALDNAVQPNDVWRVSSLWVYRYEIGMQATTFAGLFLFRALEYHALRILKRLYRVKRIVRG